MRLLPSLEAPVEREGWSVDTGSLSHTLCDFEAGELHSDRTHTPHRVVVGDQGRLNPVSLVVLLMS